MGGDTSTSQSVCDPCVTFKRRIILILLLLLLFILLKTTITLNSKQQQLHPLDYIYRLKLLSQFYFIYIILIYHSPRDS